jgi:hypothetical protein
MRYLFPLEAAAVNNKLAGGILTYGTGYDFLSPHRDTRMITQRHPS